MTRYRMPEVRRMTTQYRYDDGIGAIARSEHRAAEATPGARAGLRHTVGIDYRGNTVVRPVFTSRTLRPPIARGHRCFVLGKAVWR